MTDRRSLRVVVLGGTRLPGNVRTFLRNVRGLLADHPVHFDFELLLADDESDAPAGYDAVDPGFEATDRAIDTVRTLTSATTRYLRSDPADVLFQVTKFPAHGFAAVVAGRLAGVPVLTRLAGDNFREHRLSPGVGAKSRTYAQNNVLGMVPVLLSDATVVLGPNGRSRIRRRNPLADVYEIPQPVDFERFSPVPGTRRSRIRDELGMASEDRVLLTVGRLSRRKGMADLLGAARRLEERGESVDWYVLGDGPMRDRLGEVDAITAPGRVPHDEVVRYYRAADLLVHPSLIEGLPNVLLEAAACGLPTLSRDVGEATLVASQVYEDPDRLPDLVTREYEPTALGKRFEPRSLREAYASALLEASDSAAADTGGDHDE